MPTMYGLGTRIENWLSGRTESTEIGSHIHIQLIFNKGFSTIPKKRKVFK
jgi:hypothetical protein